MKKIVLKLSGNIINNNDPALTKTQIGNLADQLKSLMNEGFQFGIVIGGGNIFRGAQRSTQMGVSRSTGDMVGMLATMMNGLILRDLLADAGIDAVLLNALYTPQISEPITQATLEGALRNPKSCVIFAGGTGTPFFSTDTNAVVRALQIGASAVWKATNVDYLYSADPAHDKNSKPIIKISHEEVINKKLQVMDRTAITLAQEHKLPIRICNFFSEQALIRVAHSEKFGSTIE